MSRLGSAQKESLVMDATLACLGHEILDDLEEATPLDPPQNAVYAFISVEGANVRYWDDGTEPTTSEGILLYAKERFWYNGDLAAIQFIEVTAGAKLMVTYHG